MLMDLTTFSQRVRRVDFLDGLGIYVGPEHVSLALVRKRLLRVALRRRAAPIRCAPASRGPKSARRA